MAKIRKIMCCCGSGLGSSLMVQMNIEKALKNLGISGVEVDKVKIATEINEYGDIVSIVVYITDEQAANNLVNTLNQEEGKQDLGVLGRCKVARIEDKHLFLSISYNKYDNKMNMMMIMIIIALFNLII